LGTLAARHSRLGVDFIYYGAQLARHRAEALVARRQRELALFARGDVHDQADDALRGAIVGAIHDVGPVESPVPAAVGVAEAVFGLEHGGRRIDALQPAPEIVDGLLGIGAEQLSP